MEIELTKDSSLLKLIGNEFHENGNPGFNSEDKNSEPYRFIHRLTKNQLELIGELPEKQLTAFVTFGDGFFNRPIGSDYNDRKGEDNVRPNASFALFFKKSISVVELVFYTRFFVISYDGESKEAIEAREICRTIGYPPDPKKVKLAFDAMKGLRYLNELEFISLAEGEWRKPKQRYGLFIGPAHQESVGKTYIPWILVESYNKSTKKWKIILRGDKGKINTIHGVHPTQGCWMLLRNYVWNWPNENTGGFYHALMNDYLIFRQNSDTAALLKSLKEKIKSEKEFSFLKTSSDKSILRWFRTEKNYMYHQFIHEFVGLEYNDKKDPIKFWPSMSEPAQNNCWKKTERDKTAELFIPNRFNIKNSFKEPWAILYLFKRTDGFTPDPGDWSIKKRGLL